MKKTSWVKICHPVCWSSYFLTWSLSVWIYQQLSGRPPVSFQSVTIICALYFMHVSTRISLRFLLPPTPGVMIRTCLQFVSWIFVSLDQLSVECLNKCFIHWAVNRQTCGRTQNSISISFPKTSPFLSQDLCCCPLQKQISRQIRLAVNTSERIIALQH